jgi:hypothetical protein
MSVQMTFIKSYLATFIAKIQYRTFWSGTDKEGTIPNPQYWSRVKWENLSYSIQYWLFCIKNWLST